MLSTTRIFFERTTKNSHSLQALGNVYRNSKWSDLHVFNIKEGAFLQFKNLFLLLLCVFMLLAISLRFNLQWSGLFIFNINELFFYIKDLISSWVLFFFYTISLIFLKITFILTKNFQSGVLYSTSTLNSKNKFFNKSSDNSTLDFSVSTTNSNNSDVLLSSLYLQKVIKYLHLSSVNDHNVSTSCSSDLRFLNLYNIFKGDVNNVDYLIFFTNKNKFNLSSNKLGNFTNKDKLFYDCVNESQIFNVRHFKLNNNILKSLPFMFQKEFNAVIRQNLNLGRENRWLMKNSLLSYDIITKTLSTTHVKKLYGNAQFGANSAGSNIWASNRLGNSSNLQATNNISGSVANVLNTNMLNKSSLLHLDNLEESFLWLVKRFKFLQTTSTYYQFEQQNILSFSANSLPNQHNDTNKLGLFKNLALYNTNNLTVYTTHFNYKSLVKFNKNSSSEDLSLDTTSNFYLTNFDLNFSKYFFNNISLQKNNILIYSNLE